MLPNIIIVEDNPIIALDLSSYLKKLGYADIYRCRNENEAYEVLGSLKRAIVFLDINLNTKHGGIAIAKTLEHKPTFPYVYITGNTDAMTLQKIKGTHPIGFIVKPFQEEEVKALLVLADHKIKYPVEKAEVNQATMQRLFSDLTTTEQNIFLKLYEGSSNQEIADKLFVSINTVKTHLKTIFSKLGVSSRLKAVQLLLSKL